MYVGIAAISGVKSQNLVSLVSEIPWSPRKLYISLMLISGV
jgi:hypothetical protein